MAKLAWDKTGEHLYRTGIDHGVIYALDSNNEYKGGAEAWNGLTGFTKSPSGAEETKLYADNIKYLSLRSAEDFGATLTCYTYPKKFEEMNGSVTPTGAVGMKIYQQARKTFGLCVRTLIGNDTDGNDHGYELHLCYGMTASPSEEAYNTVNDSPEAIEFSYEMSSVPVAIPNTNYKPTAVITINSNDFASDDPTEDAALKALLKALEDKLYGTDGVYTKVVSPTGNPKTLGYYELVNGAYVLTEDTEVASGKDYYTQTTAPTSAYLPLPAEVISTLTPSTAG